MKTAATAPGPPAAGHAREPRDEKNSRTTMTKSISRSQVRLIASTNAIFGADEACAMLRISRDAMYRLAKDPKHIGTTTRSSNLNAQETCLLLLRAVP